MTKNPKRQEAGRKGGKVSPSNFKNNKALAREAGRKGAQARARKKLSLDNYPLFYDILEEGK